MFGNYQQDQEELEQIKLTLIAKIEKEADGWNRLWCIIDALGTEVYNTYTISHGDPTAQERSCRDLVNKAYQANLLEKLESML